MIMINRQIETKIFNALNNFRIIYIDGARQTGKSTYVKQVSSEKKFNYITFDDKANLTLAKNNPQLFFATNKPPLIIDEVQKAPNIINYIKTIVNGQANTKGQFILTGSVDLLKSAKINESLAGRMVGYELYPFSFTELGDANFNIIEVLFKQNFYEYFEKIKDKNNDEIIDRLLIGGFPEIQSIDFNPN